MQNKRLPRHHYIRMNGKKQEEIEYLFDIFCPTLQEKAGDGPRKDRLLFFCLYGSFPSSLSGADSLVGSSDSAVSGSDPASSSIIEASSAASAGDASDACSVSSPSSPAASGTVGAGSSTNKSLGERYSMARKTKSRITPPMTERIARSCDTRIVPSIRLSVRSPSIQARPSPYQMM